MGESSFSVLREARLFRDVQPLIAQKMKPQRFESQKRYSFSNRDHKRTTHSRTIQLILFANADTLVEE